MMLGVRPGRLALGFELCKRDGEVAIKQTNKPINRQKYDDLKESHAVFAVRTFFLIQK